MRNLHRSLFLDDTHEGTREAFRLLCGKYYQVTIYSGLEDSSIIDKIWTHLKDSWLLYSIREENYYIKFAVTNNNFKNYRDGSSFEIEWGVYIFDKRSNHNLTMVKEDYKSIISKIDYHTYHMGDKELIIAIIDSYPKASQINDYSEERRKLINALKQLVKEL